MAKKLGFKVQNDRKNDFFAVFSLWVGSLAFEKVAERPGITWHRFGHPHAIFEEKKKLAENEVPKIGIWVHNGRKNDFFAVLSLWVGPFRWKVAEDRASHGIALDTPHAYILKKKNFDQIYQIRSVISYLGQKNCISRSKVVQFGNFKFSTLQDPQNPKLAPHGPDGAPERKKGLESS